MAYAQQGLSSDSSSEDDGFLRFSNDLNQDGLTDYNPRKRRRTARNAKENTALGIFDSESEDDVRWERWKKKDNLRENSVRFVRTGEGTDDDDENDEDLEPEPADNNKYQTLPSARVNSCESKIKPNFSNQDFVEKVSVSSISITGSVLGKEFVPTSATAPKLLFTEEQDPNPVKARPGAFSMPGLNTGKKSATAAPVINAGSFAAKMMAKMGYKEGEGLGKEGQGRSRIIEVTLRPQGVGLGAVKEKSKQEIDEEKRQANIRGEEYNDEEEKSKKSRKKPRRTLPTDADEGTKQTPKPKFWTMEELRRAAPGLQVPNSFAPILDMTGPNPSLIASSSRTLQAPNETDRIVQIESKKLARRAQNQLSKFIEEWKNLEERKAYNQMIIIQQQKEIEKEQRRFDDMQSFSNRTRPIAQALQDGKLDLVMEALMASDDFSELGPSNEDQYLSEIAVAAIHPFLRQAIVEWQPLEDPELVGIVPQLLRLRRILGVASSNQGSINSPNRLDNNGLHRLKIKSTTAYESMIYKIIFPKILFAIDQNWDVYDPTALQTLFDKWEGLLPSFVKSQILSQAVVRKLNIAMSSWNPKRGRAHKLPHLWLFPWLQYLPSHHTDPQSSTGLLSDVKRKFRQLVDSWDFHKGIVPGLTKWRDVLYVNPENDQWSPLIMNHVLPSMSRFLKNHKNFMVDPNDQEPFMSSLEGVFAWQEIIKSRIVAQVIVKTVFPMWHEVLHQWLTTVGPNEEITQWFDWWRDGVFPEGIKGLKMIQDEFDKGHKMINQAIDLGSDAATHLPLPSFQPNQPKQPLSPVIFPTSHSLEEASFRQKVEEWCIDNDLQLLPEKKLLHSDGPLHRITAAGNGKNGALVYFKGDDIWALAKKGLDYAKIKIDWTSADSKDILLGMAWQNVK